MRRAWRETRGEAPYDAGIQQIMKFLFSTASAGTGDETAPRRSGGAASSSPWKPVIGVCLLAAVMASAIAWRVAGRPGAPSFLPILLWQAAVWLPWVGYLYAVRFLARRADLARDRTLSNVALHVLAALAVAVSHLAWYSQVSDFGSPLKGLPGTKFGVYAFFFVFWFLIDLLLYAAVLIAQDHAPAVPDSAAAGAPASGGAGPVPGDKRFVVRRGRTRHVVRAADIRWIEAQGYYAALHTESGSYLTRQSLAKLEGQLDPERFIRIHRSTIVNVGSIAGLRTDRNGAVTVELTHGGRRRASRSGYKALKDRLPGSP